MRALRPSLLLVSVLFPVLLLGACGSGSTRGETQAPPAQDPAGAAEHASAVPAADLPPGVHAVLCGCVVPGVGRCGNYAVVDGETVPLEGDVGLGKMEFCGRTGLTAALEGELVDGAFVATSYELRD